MYIHEENEKSYFYSEKKKMSETIFCHFKGLFSKVPVHSQIPEPLTSLTRNYFTFVSVLAKCKPFSILQISNYFQIHEVPQLGLKYRIFETINSIILYTIKYLKAAALYRKLS